MLNVNNGIITSINNDIFLNSQDYTPPTKKNQKKKTTLLIINDLVL